MPLNYLINVDSDIAIRTNDAMILDVVQQEDGKFILQANIELLDEGIKSVVLSIHDTEDAAKQALVDLVKQLNE